VKRSPAECMLETVAELSAKHLAENPGWEKGVARMNPARVIGGEPAAGDHTMQVRVVAPALTIP